jgi:uncharacterized protein (DUF885 family)
MPHLIGGFKRLTSVCVLAWGLAGCASLGSSGRVPRAADSLLAQAQLNETLVEHTSETLRRNVDVRLALGLRLDRLPTLVAGSLREDAMYAREVQRDLEDIWYAALTQNDYLSLLSTHWDLSNDAEAPVYRTLDYSAVIPGVSPIPAIARSLALHPIESREDVLRYIFLLDNVGLFFPELRQTLSDQAKRHITIPVPALDSVVAFVKQFRQPAARSPFALDAERLTRIDSISRGKVLAEITQKVDSQINVQIDSLIEFLDGEYRKLASDSTQATFGLHSYPGGTQYYQYLIRRVTTLEVSPNDLYTYAVREVGRISAAMAAIRTKLGFSGSDSAFRASLRGDQRFVLQSTGDFEARVVKAVQLLRDSVYARLGIAISDSLSLVARDSEILDGSRTVNLVEPDALDPRYRLEYARDQITRMPTFVIPALIAREVVPGRFALISAVRRNDTIPTLRQLMRFPGFVDGWGEHARGLVGELGLYADDHEAYGALMVELEAAARMVTDLGIHAFGWTHPNAVRYLRLHSVDPTTADGDVLRIAVAEPARAIAAKVGSREFGGQRAWVRRELGPLFNDGALQREIFRVGVLPLPLLSQHLTWFVWKTKTAGRDSTTKGAVNGKPNEALLDCCSAADNWMRDEPGYWAARAVADFGVAGDRNGTASVAANAAEHAGDFRRGDEVAREPDGDADRTGIGTTESAVGVPHAGRSVSQCICTPRWVHFHLARSSDLSQQRSGACTGSWSRDRARDGEAQRVADEQSAVGDTGAGCRFDIFGDRARGWQRAGNGFDAGVSEVRPRRRDSGGRLGIQVFARAAL